MRKIKSITLVWDDGTEEYAEGEAAQKIKEWWDGGESMAYINGARYDGPHLQVRKPEEPA